MSTIPGRRLERVTGSNNNPVTDPPPGLPKEIALTWDAVPAWDCSRVFPRSLGGDAAAYHRLRISAGERALQVADRPRCQRPQQLVFADLWPSHPYGLPAAGTEDSVSRLGAAAVSAWWRDHLAAEDATIVIVGDVSAAAARALAEARFAALPKRGTSRAPLRQPPPPPTRTEAIEYRDRKQSAIAMVFPAPPPTDPEAARLELLQNVTSGLAGTLFAELRGRRSLAYTVFAAYLARREGGALIAYLATEAAKEKEASEALLAELRRLATDGFDEKQLATAKAAFAGTVKIDHQTNGSIRDALAQGAIYGTGLDAVEKRLEIGRATTLAELRATAGRWFGAERFATGIVRGRRPRRPGRALADDAELAETAPRRPGRLASS